MEERNKVYSDSLISVYSKPDGEESYDGIKIWFKDVEYTLIGFSQIYDPDDVLVMSFKIKDDKKQFLYYIHDEKAEELFGGLEEILQDLAFVDLLAVMEHYYDVDDVYRKGAILAIP